nr:putative replication protein [Escherichia coli]
MIDIHSAFSQHLLQLTVTDAVFAVPYGPQNDVTLAAALNGFMAAPSAKGTMVYSPPTICSSAIFSLIIRNNHEFCGLT